MAIKISGSTIINDSRILENADKIGIGTANPRYDLDIFASSTPTGIAVSATNTQTTDTNKALSVFNNSNTNNFSVSYKGRVDAVEYYGTFKGTIDPSVPIENAAKIQIHHNSTNSFFNVPFFASGLADDSYQDLQYDNSNSLQYNPNTGRVRINSGDGLDSLTIRTTSNTLKRGLAFQNSGNNYTGYIGMVDIGSDDADMVFGVDNTNEVSVDSVTERLRITNDGKVGIGSDNPHRTLVLETGDGDIHCLNANGGIFMGTDNSGGFQNNCAIARAGVNNYHIGGSEVGDLCIASESGASMRFGVSPFAGGMDTFLHVSRLRNFNFYGADYKFHTGTTERFNIQNNGNIGIGTDNPLSKLHVTSATHGLVIDDQHASGDQGIVFTTNSDSNYKAAIRMTAGGSSKGFRFMTGGFTNSEERLRITSDGDVSIGSAANALRRVDVVGNSLLVRPNTTQYNSTAGNATAVNNSIIIRMPYGANAATTSNAGARFGIQFTGSNNTTDHTSLNWADDPVKSASIYGVSEDTGAGYSRKVGMAFYTSGFDAAQQERLRIDSSGNLLRGGTGQNIGASNARWATGYFDDIDATNLTGTISAPGSNTQVLFNSNGDVSADAGLTFDSGTDKLTVGGDIKLGGTGNGGTLFFDETSGGVEKIKQASGYVEVYADVGVKFLESDNDKEMVTFDLNTTYDDARIYLEGDTNTYFNHPASDQLGFTVGGNDTLRLKGGQIGISTSTLRGKLDIDTGTGQNSDVEYYGQDFGLVIKHQSGSGANEEGNGICFVQKWYNQSGELVRTGGIVGYKQSGNGSFGGGLIFKTQENGASPMSEVVRLTQDGKVGVNQSTSPSYRVVINEEATVGTPHGTLSALNPIVYIDAGNEIDHNIVLKKHETANGDKIGGLIFASSPDASNYSWAGIKAIQNTNAAAESLAFYTSTSNTSAANSPEVMRIKGAMVGIGTNNPNNPLTIHGSGNHIYLKDTATNNILQIRHSGGVAEFNSFDLDGSARRDYVFNQYASEVLRIKSNGSVNIGGNYTQTTDKFQVTGNGKINGDFTVTGTINATVTGTAENATNINVAADNSTNATHYPIFVGGATGNQRPNSDTGLTYNPSSGNLSARNFFAIADGGTTTNSQQIVAGDSSGSVALTINDGYGNANVAFNHRNGVPDSNGSSGRIWSAVDSTTAQMNFELADSAVSGQAKSMTDVLQLLTNQIKPLKNIIPNSDGAINLGTNAVRFGHGYFDNITAANIAGTVSVTGSNKQVLFNSAGNVGAATTLTIEQSKINVVGSIDLSSELNFIGSNNKYIDVETLASNNSFNIRHHNPTGNLFENAFVSVANAETKLYYDGSIRLSTTSTGVQIANGSADINLRSGTSSATGQGQLTFENVDGNGQPRDVVRIIGASHGNGGYGELRLQTAFNNTLSTRLTITEDGRIGINATSPTTNLQIGDGTTDSDNVITFGKRVSSSETNLPKIGHHSENGTSSGLALCATSSSGKIIFFTGNGSNGFGASGNAERMRIDNSGRVNIGGNYTQTTDKFQVTGSAKINGDLTITGTLAYEDVTNVVSAGIVTAAAFRALGGTFRNTTGSESHPTNVAMMIEKDDFIYTNDSTSSKRRLIGKTSGTEVIEIGQTGTALIDEIRMEPGNAGFFSVVTGGATGLPASGERIRVSAGGSFAVATTDPKEQIHLKDGAILVENVDYAANQDAPYLIAGSQNHASGGNTNTNWGTSGLQHRIKVNSGGVPRLTIDMKGNEYFSFVNGGYFGIDAPDPTAKLQVGGNTGDALRVGETEFKVHQSASNWNSLTYASNPILAWDFKSGTGDMMYMASGGNTSTANQMALVISDGHGFKIGRSGYDGTDYDVSTTNEYLRLTTSGSLNIGGDYTQTSKKLKVTGDAEITGTLTAGNLAFDGTSTGNFTIDGELIISDYIRHKDDTNTHIRFPADDTIRFTTNNSEAVEITPDRSIRIGEDSPIVLDATNEEAIYIKADIRNADADAVYGIRMDIDDDNTGTTTGDRERGSLFLHFDGNNTGGDTSNETRIYNIWNDVNIAQDYDLVRGIYNDIVTSSSTGENASLNGVYTDIRINNSSTVNLIAGSFAYARKTGANSTGSVTQMYGSYYIARNDGGATGSVTSMYGTRSEVRLSDGSTGNNANTNVNVTNAYAVYARMENDNHANGQSNSGMTALYYGTYATTNGLNNPYGLYIHSSAPNNYIGGNLEVNGNLTVNGTISDGAVTDVAVSYTGRSAPCTLPITVTGTATKTINIPTNSNAFGAKYVQTSEPTGTSICDGDVWYETDGGGTGGITIENATESTYRNITFADDSNATTLKVNDNGRLQVRPSDGAVRVAGDITAFYSSDARLKKNISPIKNALEKVRSISGNTFEWNEKTHNKGKEVGVIAQEVEKLDLPGVTTTRQDGTKAVRYEKLVPLLVEAIKELKDEINELKANASVS